MIEVKKNSVIKLSNEREIFVRSFLKSTFRIFWPLDEDRCGISYLPNSYLKRVHMNDVEQVLIKPHPQSNEHTCQGNTECWSLILDEGLLQVDYVNCAILVRKHDNRYDNCIDVHVQSQ